jgi:phosphatidylinositol dimannoside acyltransferase
MWPLDQASASRSEAATNASESRRWWRRFAVQGVAWRRFIDWAVLNLPSWLHPPIIWLATFVFFFLAASARRAVIRHLSIVLAESWQLANHFRVFRVFHNFGWTLADAAVYRLLKLPFEWELEGENVLQALAAARGAIVLTAHMGNYDLGAALFAQKFLREIRMVRAPEPDTLTAQHVDLSLQQSGSGAVRVGYSTEGSSLAFELLDALRKGEIISIQGDRVVGEIARSAVTFFGQQVSLPTGPFVLSLVSEAPIYPLFIVRTGFRKYKIIAREPITCSRAALSRDEAIAHAMQQWAEVLERTARRYWPQWYAFTPLFEQL